MTVRRRRKDLFNRMVNNAPGEISRASLDGSAWKSFQAKLSLSPRCGIRSRDFLDFAVTIRAPDETIVPVRDSQVAELALLPQLGPISSGCFDIERVSSTSA
jgi:hypothetical protein